MRSLPALAALALLLATPAVSLAASGSNNANIPVPSNLPKLPPGMSLPIPKSREHTEFVVETNKKGQVVKVDSGQQSSDRTFNAFTYGNALQAFIRTPDGHAIAGFYKLSYDYDPKTTKVHRDVELVKVGGVNPDAQGAVDAMADVTKRHAEREQQQNAKNATPLPNFRDITGHK